MYELRDDEILGRKVELTWERRRRERRAQRYFQMGWNDLLRALGALELSRAARLWFTLRLQASLEVQTLKGSDGWFTPRRELLDGAVLLAPDFNKVLSRLESHGLVEVQRRPGKRALVRLVESEQ